MESEKAINNELNDKNNVFFYDNSEGSKFHNIEDTQLSSDSTMFNSVMNSNSQLNMNSITKDHELKNEENTFNSVRNKFYDKYSLFDVPLNTGINSINFPKKYKINEKNYCFLLNNELKTYPITISGYFLIKRKYNDFDNTIEDNGSKYNESLGLYFCGKKISFENGKIEKECAPNVFICKQCMELNKKKYKIKSSYLININGRVAKINKGKYHCFGHFLCGNIIEDCINKFSCKACELITSNINYYNNNFY